MALEDVLKQEDLVVSGDNTSEGDLATESHSASLTLIPAHQKALAEYKAYKEAAGILNSMSTVDKSFAMESVTMLPILLTQGLAPRLTASSSANNKALVTHVMGRYESTMTEQLKDIATDVYLAASELIANISEKKIQMEVYLSKLTSLRSDLVAIDPPVLVISRGVTYNLAETTLSDAAYKIDDSLIMYKPFEGKLNTAAKAVIQTYSDCKLEALVEGRLCRSEAPECSLLGVLFEDRNELDKCLNSLSELTVASNRMDHDPECITSMISAIQGAESGFKLFSLGQNYLDTLIGYAELVISQGK